MLWLNDLHFWSVVSEKQLSTMLAGSAVANPLQPTHKLKHKYTQVHLAWASGETELSNETQVPWSSAGPSTMPFLPMPSSLLCCVEKPPLLMAEVQSVIAGGGSG